MENLINILVARLYWIEKVRLYKMKFNKLMLIKCLCLTLMLCLLTKAWSQKQLKKQTDHIFTLLVDIELCCSLKIEKATESLSFSVTIGNEK